MLNATEEAYVRQHLGSSDHDYFVWSGLVGERVLRNGVLCYFDGETAVVAGMPLGPATPATDSAEHLTAVVAEWARLPDVFCLNYFGPAQVTLNGAGEWRTLFSAGPRPWNLEVFLDLTGSSEVMQTPKARKDLKWAERRGLELWSGNRGYLGHEHIGLLRDLGARASLLASDTSYLANIVTILHSEATTMFEARRQEGGGLAGFAIGHRYFEECAFLVIVVVDHAAPGASDLLYAAAVKHFRDGGARRLGLGYAVDEGLFRYKMKWGGGQAGPPFHQSIWQRQHLPEDFTDCLHWPWRMLTRKLASAQAVPSPR